MEKTFENWLVVSDVDGTLHSKAHTLPKRNLNAIREFTDKGGNFTLASGRTVISINRAYRQIPANQPAVILNGGGLYDMCNRKLLWSEPIGESGMSFVRELIRRYGSVFYALDVGIFTHDVVYVVRNGILSSGMLVFDRANFKLVKLDEVPDSGWLKVIFWGMPATIKMLQQLVNITKNLDAHFMVSSPVTLEMLNKDTHKGTAVMQLAQMLGIEKSHVAAIGDYYNDWDMLMTVGLPACAGQAPKPIHEICKYEACHCNLGCVGDLLEYIMNEYSNDDVE